MTIGLTSKKVTNVLIPPIPLTATKSPDVIAVQAALGRLGFFFAQADRPSAENEGAFGFIAQQAGTVFRSRMGLPPPGAGATPFDGSPARLLNHAAVGFVSQEDLTECARRDLAPRHCAFDEHRTPGSISFLTITAGSAAGIFVLLTPCASSPTKRRLGRDRARGLNTSGRVDSCQSFQEHSIR